MGGRRYESVKKCFSIPFIPSPCHLTRDFSPCSPQSCNLNQPGSIGWRRAAADCLGRTRVQPSRSFLAVPCSCSDYRILLTFSSSLLSVYLSIQPERRSVPRHHQISATRFHQLPANPHRKPGLSPPARSSFCTSLQAHGSTLQSQPSLAATKNPLPACHQRSDDPTTASLRRERGLSGLPASTPTGFSHCRFVVEVQFRPQCLSQSGDTGQCMPQLGIFFLGRQQEGLHPPAETKRDFQPGVQSHFDFDHIGGRARNK